jgi:hypothetical protein
MICQNCHAEVDDDLIFCTNCGERLIHSQTDAHTVLINNPAATQSTVNTPAPKPPSNLKWIALILALVAIPASIFGVYLLMKSGNNQPVTQNTNKPKSPSPTSTRKSNSNQNANANISNANTANTNANANSSSGKEKIEVMDERIEIAPKEHYAVPFEIEDETARLKGKVTVIQGEKVEVFVYIKSEYDSYFPDPVHKVSGFETRKSEDSDQVLVEQEYVLVFVNNSDKPLVIQGNFGIEPMEKSSN